MHTIEILKNREVECEFRTTVVPGFVNEEDLIEIGGLVKGVKSFVLQQFVPDDTLDRAMGSLKPYSNESMTGFAESMKKYAEKVTLRA